MKWALKDPLRVLAFTILSSCYAHANDNNFFSEISIDANESQSETKLEFSGYLLQSLKYGLSDTLENFDFEREDRGISRAQTDLYSELTVNFTKNIYIKLSARGEVNWVRWEDNNQHWEPDDQRSFLLDAYIDSRFSNGHWLRVGHQLFAWGESEFLPITDVLAPRDLREPLQVELQNLRMQIPALSYSIPTLSGNLNLIATYDARDHRFPESDDEFYPYINIKALNSNIRREDPENLWEYALKYDYKGNATDLSLLAARINNNDYSRTFDLATNTLLLTQDRITVLGFSVNRAISNWLFSVEAAHWNNTPENNGNRPLYIDQVRSGLILKYSGIDSWQLSFEINKISFLDSPQDSGQPPDDDSGYVIHARNSAFNDKLISNLWYFVFPQNDGSVFRADMQYKIHDNVHINSGLVLYDASRENRLLGPYKSQDTLNLSIRFLF